MAVIENKIQSEGTNYSRTDSKNKKVRKLNYCDENENIVGVLQKKLILRG